MILASFAEVVSIGAIFPFLGILTSPDKIFNNSNLAPFIQILNINKPNQLLLPISILFATAIIVSSFTRFLLLWFQTKLGFSMGSDFSNKIYELTLFQPFEKHLERNSSEIIAGISNKVNFVIYQVLLPSFSFVSSFIMILVILLSLLFINFKITIISILGFSIFYGLIILKNKKILIEYGAVINSNTTLLIKVLQEGLGGIRDVLIDGTQNTYLDFYRKADQSLRFAQSKTAIISSSPRFLLESIGMILIIMMSYYLAVYSDQFSTAIPILGSFALASQRLLPLLQQAYLNWSSLMGGKASLIDTLELLNQPKPNYFYNNNPKSIKFENLISLVEVSYNYKSSNSRVLNDINLDIKKGSCIGFIGKTGSGKSTLLDIIMGLLTPTKGKILVDNEIINTENHRSWQSRLAHVPQFIYLSDTSIAENIAFGIPYDKIDHNKVKLAAQKSQLDETILTWEMGYKTVVGERGVRLSGGQRQRIGIARALYKNADVLVFDEATSALDNKTEGEIINAIESLGQNLTIILVAHRLTTLKYCNKIYEIDNGQIINSGSYNDLVVQKK
jgi:ATP-binding cassette subfamily B protein